MASEFQTLYDIGSTGGGRNPAQETRFQELSKGMGGGGNDFPNISLNDVGGSAVDFAKGINGMSDTAFNDYLTAAKSQAKPLDIYNTLEDKAGLPTLRKTAGSLQGQIGSLEDTINNVEPTVNATTMNSLVTEGQRTGMVNAQKYPWIQQLTPMSTALGRVQQGISSGEANINNMVGYAVQGNQQELDPYKTHMNIVAEQGARLMTGFTSDKETKLNLLLEKIHRGEALSDAERNHAWDLSKAETDFQNKMKETEATNKNKFVNLGKYGLYDTSTGTIVGAGGGGGGGGGNSGGFQLGGGSDPLGLF